MSAQEALAECEAVCTSGCHADDCEHHGHLAALSPSSPDRLREAIQFDAIPTLLIFAEGNAGVRAVIDKLRAALDSSTGDRPEAAPTREAAERNAITHDRTWASGYAAGRAAASRSGDRPEPPLAAAWKTLHDAKSGPYNYADQRQKRAIDEAGYLVFGNGWPIVKVYQALQTRQSAEQDRLRDRFDLDVERLARALERMTREVTVTEESWGWWSSRAGRSSSRLFAETIAAEYARLRATPQPEPTEPER